MRVAFWYQHGKINEIGMGHKFRARFIGGMLAKRGHVVSFIEDDVINNNSDVMVIDHAFPPEDVAHRSKLAGMKVVVIDGKEPIADVSISSFHNDLADYKGLDYLAFPIFSNKTKYNYNPGKKNSDVFVAMGGFDKNNYIEVVLNTLDEMKINAIVAPSINHTDLRRSSRIEIFEDDNYYNAMKRCLFAITNGGLTFFQSLYYGMPTIAIPQYEHQKANISFMSHCCLQCSSDRESLKINIQTILSSEIYRKNLSMAAQNCVDGRGAERICDIIESFSIKESGTKCLI